MWKMINYEVCGRGHARNNKPCQDKTITVNNNDAYVIALADGAGSASHSHFGAQSVVRTISKFLSHNFYELLGEEDGAKVKEKLLKVLREDLKYESKKHTCNIKDLASTLLAVAIKDNSFLIVHIGDGIIGMMKNHILKVVSKPQNGEFSNSTIFVTSNNAINYIKLYKGKTDNINGFIIMSDGAGESFYHKQDNSFSSGVKKIINHSILFAKDQTYELLKHSIDGMVRNNTLDDCSIALMVNDYESKMIYKYLDLKEKCKLFNIELSSNKLAYKRLCKYEKILKILNENPTNIDVLAKRIYIKGKYLKKTLLHLESVDLVKRCKMKYYSNINF